MTSAAAFLESERRCAAHPDDAPARRRMLELFFALGRPDDLPGASWTLAGSEAKLRVAVVTPYYREPLATLVRCHGSVRAQTVACEHILVADGHPRPELDGWPVRHVQLDVTSGDFGDTPRRVAGEVARKAAFDAVVYLDADNWLRPRHVQSLVACHRATGAPLCHSARTLHRMDGSVMPLLQRSDNTEHVDTSCLFVAAAAFDLLALWGDWPLPLSRIDDRMFWSAAMARGHAHAFTGSLTTAYEASHEGFYRAIGEPPSPGVRPDVDLPGLFAWFDALPEGERDALDRRVGFDVAGVMARLGHGRTATTGA